MAPLRHQCLYIIPYSGKLSREKTFTNFANLVPFVKVISTKIGLSRFGLFPVCGESTKVFSAKYYISLIRESFLPRKFPTIRYIHVL